MPVVSGRLICCICGNDLGDAEDPYRDPSCASCERRAADDEARYEAECNCDQPNQMQCDYHGPRT